MAPPKRVLGKSLIDEGQQKAAYVKNWMLAVGWQCRQ